MSNTDVERSIACRATCPGVGHCEHGHMVSVVIEEEFFGVIQPVLRRGFCEVFKPYQKQKEIERAIASSKIPHRFSHCTFSSFGAKNGYLAKVKQMVESSYERAESLVLAGNSGAGKTHLAAAIAHEAVKKGQSVIFVAYVSLMSDLKNSFSDDSEMRTEKIIKELREADCLVLDDVGQEIMSNYASERLFDIVNDRYNSCKQLIITTNCHSPSELLKKIDGNGQIERRGAYIVRRLKDMAKWIFIDTALARGGNP